MTVNVNVKEAQTNILNWLIKVEQGEDIVINKAGKPLAKLSAIKEKPFQRRLDGAKGVIIDMNRFNEPLSDFDEYQ